MRLAPLTLLFAAAVCSGEDAKPRLPEVHTSIVITASPLQPSVDQRNGEIFQQTLFSRDDQIFHLLDGGINAGQHEGGGKSVEIRRFGFNLDHGGVGGGLKILVDNIQQNQTTQGHGQGYLGSLKSITPELVQEVNLINGPFSAEYGDFSGLGVVHIRLRESMPDKLTARFQGGSFNGFRGFLGFSPELREADAIFGYEASRSDGPFLDPLRYKRDNLTGAYTRRGKQGRRFGLKLSAARNDFFSSGQLPLDEVRSGRLDPFGFIDPTHGGDVQSGHTGLYYSREASNGAVWKLDGFVARSLFDLYSNFTYFLNDPEIGDGIQQHDSRLQQGANAQYLRPHSAGGVFGYLTAGGNFHANQINVGLYSRDGRLPLDTLSKAHANVTNGAGYVQESLSLLTGRLQLTGGLRFDQFRFDVDRTAVNAGKWQPKAALAFTPTARIPVTLHANYGRGISTADARVIVQRPDRPRIATTDFYEIGAAHRVGRFSASTDLFFIDRSHEQVYLADDGTFEFQGPSRAYGFEGKLSLEITRRLSLNGGFTKVANAFFRGTDPREYVSTAPHFVANAGLTLAGWKGWSGSLRMRAINHYRLDSLDPGIVALGHTVFDFGVSRRIHRGIDFNLTIDNVANRSYWEMQNYFESRLSGQPAMERIHGTPGYRRTFMAGLTFRLFGK
ncbi:MAG: TonB-dependent receptor [Bryobacteraceae bacterium]|nr:TonB-dependent receptor [Bryobacteraceae bacterium]